MGSFAEMPGHAGRTLFAWLLCLAVTLWTVVPAAIHVPNLVATLAEHNEMIETHGHSHGFEEDLAWALHGHGHDVVDHDHGVAVLLVAFGGIAFAWMAPLWGTHGRDEAPPPLFRVDRPPRA